MNAISVSQLKVNPAKAMAQADDYPLAIKNRNKTRSYLLGKDLFEKLISFVEDYVDSKAVKKVDFSDGRDFEEMAKELGI